MIRKNKYYEYHKKWRQKNRKKLKKQRREKYLKNKQHENALSLKYYKNNKSKILKYLKLYAQQHRKENKSF